MAEEDRLRYAEAVALHGKAALRIVYVNDPLLIAAAAAVLQNRERAERSARELQEFINATIAPSSIRQLR